MHACFLEYGESVKRPVNAALFEERASTITGKKNYREIGKEDTVIYLDKLFQKDPQI